MGVNGLQSAIQSATEPCIKSLACRCPPPVDISTISTGSIQACEHARAQAKYSWIIICSDLLYKLTYLIIGSTINCQKPAKRRPYLVLDVNQDGTFTAVPITSRAGKGWEELSRKDRLRFLPIGRCPEGISRPVVNLESVTSSWRGESSLLASESLIFLDVIETFRPEAMCGCQGRVSEESLLLAKCESARNQWEPQVQGSDSTNPFSILEIAHGKQKF
ncbi:uncharacterized protein H6S33_007558 [Morchella sextelata]|uniref:uncharacterized protein n=1 Tax=Morchella sextelata TaxID=1174677 RepID=UPI001D047D79|nr:uncharacterized protein H6S33_007558 [Morchella sextelata]KAH0603899.1 hypothetical protein H6S33_007558 [Morchella sextelata]